MYAGWCRCTWRTSGASSTSEPAVDRCGDPKPARATPLPALICETLSGIWAIEHRVPP
jgi:hypothetical protein